MANWMRGTVVLALVAGVLGGVACSSSNPQRYLTRAGKEGDENPQNESALAHDGAGTLDAGVQDASSSPASGPQ